MKRFFISICLILPVFMAAQIDSSAIKDSFYLLAPAEVQAVRAPALAPFSKTNLSRKDIATLNSGRDLPYLLQQTPSVVANADAGNGIGYTGLRIRGTDATRINVTLNGVPYNDPESQGTFFVNLPDLASSINSLQIQRGAGTSSNGGGAFGASINLSTNESAKESYVEFNNSFGSFNSWKNTLKAGTGVFSDHYSVDVRLSRISSDGYIDRASSNLGAAFLTAAYKSANSELRFTSFTGIEKTYQAWNGISETDLKNGNRRVNYSGTEKPGSPYVNETDNYHQTHYQLFFTQHLKQKLSFNSTFFLTRGKGYYEQYKSGRDFSEFGLPDITAGTTVISSSDFVRRLWLDNYFYGTTFSLIQNRDLSTLVFGGSLSRYDGEHYGRLMWSLYGGIPKPDYTYYRHPAHKNDLNFYTKWSRSLGKTFNAYLDLQYRHVDYRVQGFRDNPSLQVNKSYNFFNPKAGIRFTQKNLTAFLSYGIAAKEPNRDDFEAGASQQPKPERLHDFEAGVEKRIANTILSATVFYMMYEDQLVLTGRVNDVGAYTRTNIPRSYRAGVEVQGSSILSKSFNLTGNISYSQNKLRTFTEYIDDYDNGGQIMTFHQSPTIAFSPDWVAAATMNFLPTSKLEFSLLSKYVSRQFLDNTNNTRRSLEAFFNNDFRAQYTFTKKARRQISLAANIYNIFNAMYEPNGYTFSYYNGGETVTENYYFPMAGTNFMLTLNIKL